MNKFLKSMAILLLYGLIILFSLEVLLRLAGNKVYESNAFEDAPALIAEDQQLGWKLLPGRSRVGPLNEQGKHMQLTVNPDGSRSTGNFDKEQTADQLLLIGGSFAMGYGVDDHETFAWQLNQQNPDIIVKNKGVGGYGAYQSLMVLEDQLENKEMPKVVIYNMIGHHRLRDVAQSSWLEVLHYQKSRKIKPKVPYVTLSGESAIIRHEPTSVQILPFSDYLVTFLMAQRAYNKLLSMRRVSQSETVFKHLVKEMQRLCTENNIIFYLNIMDYPEEEMSELIDFLQVNQIRFIDSNIKLTNANTIPGDGHPNAALHRLYTEKISSQLQKDGLIQAE